MRTLIALLFCLTSVLLFSSCASQRPSAKQTAASNSSRRSRRTRRVVFNDEYYADYFRNFVARKPNGWAWSSDTLDTSFWKPSLIKFMLVNSKTGGIITLRYGSKKSFGLPPFYSLDEPETAYESKIIRGGSFDRLERGYKVKSPCFKNLWMLYYDVKYKNIPYKLVVFARFRGELFFIELLTPEKSFQEDMAAFKGFIDGMLPVDSLNNPKKKPVKIVH